ncbi:MAG: 50S ribosomal protein L18 [Candidatus Kapabacteria bacterium]|nr:50S ribosomal protein L18 [Candidatus Kapabacteria bacterium]
MKRLELKNKRRTRRKFRIRKRISGTPERLRLSVYRSLNNIYAQIIDDVEGKTLVSASTLDKEVKEQIKPDMKPIDKSKIVGMILAKKALDKNIKKIAFDRNGYLYHGRVKALAESARSNGLEF